jgi:hypothetical protein
VADVKAAPWLCTLPLDLLGRRRHLLPAAFCSACVVGAALGDRPGDVNAATAEPQLTRVRAGGGRVGSTAGRRAAVRQPAAAAAATGASRRKNARPTHTRSYVPGIGQEVGSSGSGGQHTQIRLMNPKGTNCHVPALIQRQLRIRPFCSLLKTWCEHKVQLA